VWFECPRHIGKQLGDSRCNHGIVVEHGSKNEWHDISHPIWRK
jgi:hypothetical protein